MSHEKSQNNRVLIFDAEGEVERLVRDVLAETPCEVASAQSGGAPDVTFTYSYPFEAVVINLTRHTGIFLDLIPAIRKVAPKAGIFAVSRLADEELWLEVLNRGADDLFMTPPDRAELLGVLLQAIQTHASDEAMNTADAA